MLVVAVATGSEAEAEMFSCLAYLRLRCGFPTNKMEQVVEDSPGNNSTHQRAQATVIDMSQTKKMTKLGTVWMHTAV